jgi:proline iminopeptidase
MEIKEGHLIFGEYKTYYRIVNPNGRKIPLLLLHGGPGSTHNSFEVLDSLAFEDDRPFIMYDQLGCGLSSDAKDPSMYCKETWVKELMNVRDKLGLKKVHLLGHSWGGMLEIIYSCDYMPKGICSMVFSSTLASASLWREETHRLINLMPEKERMDILLGEEKQDFENEDFKMATELYMHRHVSGPWTDKDPECLTRPKRTGGLSYVTAWGPSEYAPLGNLKDYEYLDKLSRIKCPVLLFDGADDESTPYQNLSMYEKLTCEKKWVMFSHSRHMSLYEEKEKYAQELLSFLNHVDNCEGNR